MLQAGCTAVVAVLKGRHLFVANAGDSRAVLARGTTAMALSEDHKPASPTEKSRITTAGGFVSEVSLRWPPRHKCKMPSACFLVSTAHHEHVCTLWYTRCGSMHADLALLRNSWAYAQYLI